MSTDKGVVQIFDPLVDEDEVDLGRYIVIPNTKGLGDHFASSKPTQHRFLIAHSSTSLEPYWTACFH